MTLNYRLADKTDSTKLADMISTASGGVVEYLFHDLVPNMSPVQVVAHHLENDHYPHTYKSAVVACDGDDVVGMALSYPSSYHHITVDMKSLFPADRLAHLSHFFSSRIENSWFLDALCVIASHRRCGIGEKLISLTKAQAVENGYDALSLIAFADNTLALPLYQRHGFEIVQKVELQGNRFIKHKDGCVLMKCEFAA